MLGIALGMLFIMNMIVQVHITRVFIQNKTNADCAEGVCSSHYKCHLEKNTDILFRIAETSKNSALVFQVRTEIIGKK